MTYQTEIAKYLNYFHHFTSMFLKNTSSAIGKCYFIFSCGFIVDTTHNRPKYLETFVGISNENIQQDLCGVFFQRQCIKEKLFKEPQNLNIYLCPFQSTGTL